MSDSLIFLNSKKQPLQSIMHSATCPACGYHVAVNFYNGGKQPLTTLAWPKTETEAQAMEKLPLNFVSCADCGHVYNKDFDYTKVPYSDKPNLMYNKGKLWKDHLELTCNLLADRLPENPVVIEIGAGDGHFLKSLAQKIRHGRFVAFDPNGAMDVGDSRIEFYPMLFEPGIHMAEYKPDLIICRHVLEHLTNPLGFVQSFSFAAAWEGLETALFVEVPCIDRVFASGRTVDFFYEHNSHFTAESLNYLLLRSQTNIEIVERGYEDEVVYGLAVMGTHAGGMITGMPAGGTIAGTHTADPYIAGTHPSGKTRGHESLGFFNRARDVDHRVCRHINELAASGRTVAFWGGTGKASSFINRYGVDCQRFPVVVDSDMAKVGTHVPGTGQAIRPPQYLLEYPVDVIVITTQWRAQDIALEIRELGIPCTSLLLEYQGDLVDFHTGTHPYRTQPKPKSHTSTANSWGAIS